MPISGIGKVIDRPLERIGARHEIGVQDEDEFSLGLGQSAREGSRLETGPALAVIVFDIETFPLEAGDLGGGNFARFVSRVVQDLDLELFARIIEPAHRVDQSSNDVIFVKHRQLHRDGRKLAKFRRRLDPSPPILKKQIDDKVAVKAEG